MAKKTKTKFTIEGRVKPKNPTLKPLYTDPAYRPRREPESKFKAYTRKGRNPTGGEEK